MASLHQVFCWPARLLSGEQLTLPTSKTIFYAWQSWRSPDTSRNVIEWALQRALKQLSRKGDHPVLLDRDTTGVPGAPHIPDTIHEKIATAVAFVADVSPVVRLTVDGRDHEVPNPNVMHETGLAVGHHGWRATVLCFNAALGDPRLLPFDLDKHRLLQYELAERSDDEEAEAFFQRRKAAREKLVGDLVVALGGIVHDDRVEREYGLIDISGHVFRGVVERVSGDEWTCLLVAPLRAQEREVLTLAQQFQRARRQYVSLSKAGMARELVADSIALERRESGVVAVFRVLPEAAREPAQKIGRDIDLENETASGDLGLTPGGVEDIPRRLRQVLSMQKGEWFLDPNVGSLVSAYASDFDYQLLPDLIALELARIAFVNEERSDKTSPLSFVRKVKAVTLPENRPDDDWIEVTMGLDVEGVGDWEGRVRLFVPRRETGE